MIRSLPLIPAATALLSSTALADAPRVAADIAPVHSLVARVMEGVDTPALVIPAGASPHEYSLRPSEARTLQDADLVFWTGEDLTPWLADALGTLAEGAEVTALLDAEGVTLLPMREGALFEAHDHGEEDHDEHEHDEHGHDDHGHDDDGHDDEEHGHDDHAGHAHGEHDTHAWLAPDNAAAWLDVIAGKLSAADPANAETYLANAAAGRAEIEALSAEIETTLAPVRGRSFLVFHDAYQYFETTFGLSAAGAISLSDATDPSPARIAEIQARVTGAGIDCVLSEPQFNAALVATVLDGTEAGTAVMDPLGSGLEPGPMLYPQMMRNLAQALADCG
ncbi:zinc ABC transporter substrate-binding protein [Jannaschia seohaensis]|uniref:High-affinity zinc uptake system protein ZnuA n=1 Tax=Jannaschia seohaensis TaxID=475081 RepID=A0A2Y9ATC7_9RHOB|nr:zinc ABC transporter substrate-binding protein [Jannaschia seohaensis]PWJ17532.1 zinc transport system substrate-binding protein [Jannaschia seohaensis]SSA47671.1 zinc transport system substrate-binding protein [Jannaschia seohaensis]